MPQHLETSELISSAPTSRDETVLELARGNTVHQIFFNDSYIYKISSSFEKLYRIQVHRKEGVNEAGDIRIYKRVKSENMPHSSLVGSEEKKLLGKAEAFNGTKYDLFQLVKSDVGGKYLYGYKVVLKKPFSRRQKLYFEFEKKVGENKS